MQYHPEMIGNKSLKQNNVPVNKIDIALQIKLTEFHGVFLNMLE